MKNKKIIILIILALLLLLGGGFTYYFLTKEDKVTTLNLFEKQWIENNKNNVIDMSIISDIPIFSYNGEGVIVEFLDSLNKETNLSFNKVSYKSNENAKSAYAFQVVDTPRENDILICQDNYVILTKDNQKYNKVSDIPALTIGVLSSDLDSVNHALYGANVTYQSFENIEELTRDFNSSETTLNGIVLLKTAYLKTIFENQYTIAYNINDYTRSLVLSLGDTDRLNTILTKYYKKWSNENYEESYDKFLTKNYFNFRNINDSESVKFRSKRYTYGYVENAPFDKTLNGKLAGINSKLLANFSRMTNAEIHYRQYESVDELLTAFNTNQIDFFYGINANTEYALDVYQTSPIYDNRLVVLKHPSNLTAIDSIRSLKNVILVENTKIQNYLNTNGITSTSYKTIEQAIDKASNNNFIVMDFQNYQYYSEQLKPFFVAYQMDIDDVSYVIRSISDNKIFSEFLDFYIHFCDDSTFTTQGLSELLIINKAPIILKYIAFALGIIVSILLILLAIVKLRPKKKTQTNLSKEDKLRYIDALTSVKNRNYLNDCLEKWDSSEIYPQTIVIVDLNNIAYINDNYGHTEGDAVIKQAANILIMNQVENSEIIRTNGNEFLIYLVGHDEKQVITYMRKLGKEFKELSHGFGAALGYSMIHDAIKTIDDAINEATLDMRNNKEEASH